MEDWRRFQNCLSRLSCPTTASTLA